MENVSPLKKGPWTAEEDALLQAYVKQYGEGNWNCVQKYSGVARCGKSCRLRWTNHLRPNLKKCRFSPQEERLIIEQHALLGNRWSRISAMLHGRTDNEVKNFWNTRVKRHMRAGQPLYPPDIVPVASTCSQQREPECSADERRAVSLRFSGGSRADSNTGGSSHKSMSTGIQSLKTTKGETCVVNVSPKASQVYLKNNGPLTKSSNAIDERGFLLTSGTNMPSPGVYDNVVSSFGHPREVPFNKMMGSASGGPFCRFSSPNMCLQQPERCFYDVNMGKPELVYHGFPYEPEPPDRQLSMYALASSGVSFGVHDKIGSKQSTATSSCNFSSPRHEIECLNGELPSVQLAESADSSSSLSSPFSASQSLPLSEVDSFGSTSNECTATNSGRLFDVLLQQNGPSPKVLSADLVKQLLVVTPNNVSPKFTGPSSFQNLSRVASNDPLSLLGGRSLTLLTDDWKTTSENASPTIVPMFALQGIGDSNLNANGQLPLLNMETEDSVGPSVDEELDTLLAFERPDGYALYDERAHSGSIQLDQVGHSGGLEVIFGQNANVDFDQLAAMSGLGNISELGDCAWNCMPGAL